MVDGALERQGASASRAFGFSKKYLKSKKLSRKNFCNLFFITRFSKIFLNMSGPNVRNRATCFRARRWWRAQCVVAPSHLPVGNNITTHDVKHCLHSVLLEKHVLWIIEQLRRQNQSRLTRVSQYCLFALGSYQL